MKKNLFIITYVFCAVYIGYNNMSIGYCKTQFFRMERPKVIYFNPEFLGNLSLTAKRISRSDPMHYVNISFDLLKTVNNEYTLSAHFYQLLSNTYRRSFVEINLYACNIFSTQNMFGDILLPAYNRLPISERPYPIFKCPIKPGYYRFELLTIKANSVPKNFPFTEGRLYLNLTRSNVALATVSLDFQLCVAN